MENAGVIVHRLTKQKKTKYDYIERHAHKFFHFIYGLSGVGRVILGQKEITMTGQWLVMIAPGVEHEIFGVDNFMSYDVKFQCSDQMTEKLKQSGMYIKHVDEYMDFLFKDLFTEGVRARYGYQEIINAKMTEILFYILRYFQEGMDERTDEYITTYYAHAKDHVKMRNIMPALNYIDANIDKQLENDTLANLCGYAENYFSTYFKSCMGCSPTQYISTKRIEVAKSLMGTTDMNITQISEKLGFESIHYFSRVFKKIVGMTPKEYIDKSKLKLDIGLNIVDNAFTPLGEYEIPLKKINDVKCNRKK